MVRRRLEAGSDDVRAALFEKTKAYRQFRAELGTFLSERFGAVCSEKCFQSRLSACCAKDGILTFFGDQVVNVLVSTPLELDRLVVALHRSNSGYKCVYLSTQGCIWKIKPIVCEMFLCDAAKNDVFEKHPEAAQIWECFLHRRKGFTWPDHPVLFDFLEQYFIDRGETSPLMYLHNSPGLLRVKEKAKEAGKNGTDAIRKN